MLIIYMIKFGPPPTKTTKTYHDMLYKTNLDWLLFFNMISMTDKTLIEMDDLK